MLVYRAGIAILLVSPLSQVAGSLAGTSVNLIVLVTGAGVQLIFIMVMNVVGVGGGGEGRGGEGREGGSDCLTVDGCIEVERR